MVAPRQHAGKQFFCDGGIVVEVGKQHRHVGCRTVPAFQQCEGVRAASWNRAVASSTLSGCAPKRDSTGICRVSEALSESMVWMRRRAALSCSFQPSFASCSSALRACRQVDASCGSEGGWGLRAAARAAITRRRISAAALRVKVIAVISSGRCTIDSNTRNRWMRSSVLPEPAGAWTINEREASSARSRSLESGALTNSFIFGNTLAQVEFRSPLVDAADRMQVAEFAGTVATLRIDPCIARSEPGAEPVELYFQPESATASPHSISPWRFFVP